MLKSATYWGLDFAGSAIKGVKLRRTSHGLEVVAADVVKLEGEAAPEASFGRDRRIWKALGEFRSRNSVSTAAITISVPARATFLRPLNLVLVGNKSEADLVKYEVQQHIPFGLDAIVWDYEIFPQRDPLAREREGLLVAVKKEVLNNYLLSLSSARLQAGDIQCSPVALYNFVRYEFESEATEPYLIIDIGATCTDLIAVDGDRYHVQTLSSGGETFTKMLQEKFNIDAERAETVKLHVAQLKHARHILENLLPPMRGYASELNSAVQRFQSVMAGRKRFGKVYLFGAASRMVGLERMINDALETEVIVPRELNRLKIARDADAEHINSNLPSLAVALGLALQNAGVAKSKLSLISAPAVKLRQASKFKPIAAAAILLMGLFTGANIYLAQQELQTVKSATVSLTQSTSGPMDRLDKWKKMTADVPGQKQLDEYEKLASARVAWMTAIAEISRLAHNVGRPDDQKLWIMSIDIKPGEGDDLTGSFTGAVVQSRLIKERINDIVQKGLAEKKRFHDVRVPEEQLQKGELVWKTAKPGRYALFRVTFSYQLNPSAEGPN
jgi:type IV pilus assembly protein PilM